MAGRQTSKKASPRRLKDLKVKGKKSVKGGATALKTYKVAIGTNLGSFNLGNPR